jgi:hypothetical protein
MSASTRKATKIAATQYVAMGQLRTPDGSAANDLRKPSCSITFVSGGEQRQRHPRPSIF